MVELPPPHRDPDTERKRKVGSRLRHIARGYDSLTLRRHESIWHSLAQTREYMTQGQGGLSHPPCTPGRFGRKKKKRILRTCRLSLLLLYTAAASIYYTVTARSLQILKE